MSNFPVPPAVPEAPKGPSGFYLFARVFDEPGMVFKEITQKPRIGVALLMVLVALAIQSFAVPTTVLRTQVTKGFEAAAKFGGNIPPEAKQAALDNAGSIRSRVIGSITGSVVFAIISCIITLVYWGLFSMAGAEVTFLEELSIVLHANAPALLGVVVVAALSPVTQSATFNIGLGFLVSYDTSPFFHTFLTFLTVFSVWQLYLVALGNQIKRKAKTIGGSLTLVAITFVVIAMPMALLFSKFGNFTG